MSHTHNSIFGWFRQELTMRGTRFVIDPARYNTAVKMVERMGYNPNSVSAKDWLEIANCLPASWWVAVR